MFQSRPRDPERPAFHLAPPHGGWLNDPNGPMVDKDGRIHLV
jgi:sucrose-6-phosphate hydrolase SacC (GH32 family)